MTPQFAMKVVKPTSLSCLLSLGGLRNTTALQEASVRASLPYPRGSLSKGLTMNAQRFPAMLMSLVKSRKGTATVASVYPTGAE